MRRYECTSNCGRSGVGRQGDAGMVSDAEKGDQHGDNPLHTGREYVCEEEVAEKRLGLIFLSSLVELQNIYCSIAMASRQPTLNYLVLPQFLSPLSNSVEVARSRDHVIRPQDGAKVDAQVRERLNEKN